MKSSLSRLITAAVCLVAVLALTIGTTFAWFTTDWSVSTNFAVNIDDQTGGATFKSGSTPITTGDTALFDFTGGSNGGKLQLIAKDTTNSVDFGSGFKTASYIGENNTTLTFAQAFQKTTITFENDNKYAITVSVTFKIKQTDSTPTGSPIGAVLYLAACDGTTLIQPLEAFGSTVTNGTTTEDLEVTFDIAAKTASTVTKDIDFYFWIDGINCTNVHKTSTVTAGEVIFSAAKKTGA